LLESLGAQLIFFSPLAGDALPACDALWLPGGYPELHAVTLAQRHDLFAQLHNHVKADKPLLAECGGMMTLFDTLTDAQGATHSMAALLPGRVVMQPRLTALGGQETDLPEGTLRSTGRWLAAREGSPWRKSEMNFVLDVRDAGALLTRLGTPEALRGGTGQLEGMVSWQGSPLELHYPSLNGHLDVRMGRGQFLKADPGIAKLLGVLSLQALPRRLTLDFRDVFSEGFSFDFLRGDVKIDQGMAFTNNLQMKGVNAAVLMEGSADLARETQDLKVVVIPEINAGTAALLATAINPAVGLGTFLAQMFLRRPLIESATQEFHIDGPWADPHITKVSRSAATIQETKP